MNKYTSASAQYFDGEYVIATLLNQAYDLRKTLQVCSSETEAEHLLERAQELETAAQLLEAASYKLVDAWKAIGDLADAAGVFDDPGVVSAMKYMLDSIGTMDEEYRFEMVKPTLRMRADDWLYRKWRKIRHLVGYYYDWERP